VRRTAPGLLAVGLICACGGASGGTEADDPTTSAAVAPREEAPRARAAAPEWTAELIEIGTAVEDEAGLERFVGLAGQRFEERLMLGGSPAQAEEARAAIQMLIRLEWDPVVAGAAEFADEPFRRALSRTTIGGLVRLLAGQPPEIQLGRLRCALLDLQLRTLRRDALAAAKQRFDGSLTGAAASARGMELALMVELLGTQERDLARSCDGAELRAADLANSRIDVGFVVGGDPCDTLSWDVFIYIQGKDDLAPVAERTLGGECKPNVLVLD
jgi:hypothetical protein